MRPFDNFERSSVEGRAGYICRYSHAYLRRVAKCALLAFQLMIVFDVFCFSNLCFWPLCREQNCCYRKLGCYVGTHTLLDSLVFCINFVDSLMLVSNLMCNDMFLLFLQDQFDTIDFSDNEIRKLEGFPLLTRLKSVLLSNNRVW